MEYTIESIARLGENLTNEQANELYKAFIQLANQGAEEFADHQPWTEQMPIVRNTIAQGLIRAGLSQIDYNINRINNQLVQLAQIEPRDEAKIDGLVNEQYMYVTAKQLIQSTYDAHMGFEVLTLAGFFAGLAWAKANHKPARKRHQKSATSEATNV